ncbi:hypothetical protein ACFQY0_13005 [Haloferula chungangensis]|uniref:Glycosyltransferase n=1 Tax=Haloferula chungangensis TaxID=1048331 RepID=A0ABW2L965_9BACT
MRILITEEALETGAGHWPSYIGDLAGKFREMGDTVDVLAHRDASPETLSRVGGTPWYSRNCWRDSRSQGKVGGLLHNWYFYRETLKFLKHHPPYDRVLALTMRMQHLLAFAALVRSRLIPSSTRFVLLFVQGFGQYVGPGQATIFPENFSSKLARAAFRAMAPAVRSGRVILAGETAGMCDELQRFTGLPATLFPHPVEEEKLKSEIGREPETKNKEQGTRNQEPGTKNQEPLLTITCPGYARHEKGSDLLHDAILEVIDQPWAKRLRFVMQWPEPFDLPDGSSMSPDERLVNHPRVEFLNQSLDPLAYAALLERSDLVILPYRSESYHQRLSRVAIEAAGKGIPLIYSVHTWTQEVVDLVGGGVPICDESVESVVKALRDALDCYPSLKLAAVNGAAEVAVFHKAESFRTHFT